MDARHASPICSSRRSPSADSFCVQLNEPRLRYGVIILRYHKKKKKKKREREREREREDQCQSDEELRALQEAL